VNVCGLQLGKPWGRGLAERRSCVCGSLAWQVLGAWACRVDIVQACAGLRVWPGRDRECLWIPGLAGFKGSFGGDREVLSGGGLG
jgi:hypothetical protein